MLKSFQFKKMMMMMRLTRLTIDRFLYYLTTIKKIIFNRLKAFINKTEILYRSQYGFRDKHSTRHAILDVVNSLQRNMDKKLFTCGIFIDLKKAFDTVDHSILLNKLNHYGARGIVNDWFSSYQFKRIR